MKDFALGYVINSLWQTPLLFAVAWLVARAARRLGVVAEHRIWTAALMLEAVLPACMLDVAPMLQAVDVALRRFRGAAEHGGPSVTVTVGPVYVHSGFQPSARLLTALLAAYTCVTLYFGVRLAWRVWRSSSLRRHAQPLVLPVEAANLWQDCSRRFHMADASIASTPEVSGPVTLGVFGRLLLLPSGWLETLNTEDLHAAFAHEFVHMHRRDFAKNLFYQVLSLPVAYHPALRATLARVAASREILCDTLAADVVAGRQQYARSLLRLAEKLCTSTRPPTHAIGIFDANHLERRVMNLTHQPIELRGFRRFATTAACIALGLGACASAVAMRVDVAASTSAPSETPAPAQVTVISASQPAAAPQLAAAPQPAAAPRLALRTIHSNGPIVSVEVMPAPAAEAQADSPIRIAPGVMSANMVSKVNPVYPDLARAAHVQGAVVLHAIIGKDGAVEKLTVISGPRELMGSALDAVRQWVYKPYLLNGNPTEVETDITVNYNLTS